MNWQPKRLTAAQREERRLAAGRLLRRGTRSQAEIARYVGVSRASVTRWKRCLERQGLRGLRHRRPPGRPSHLAPGQWRRLLRILERGAMAAGFDTERWTLRRIAAVIAHEFGVHYHPRSWLKRDWPRVKRGLAAQGAPLSSWTRRVTRFGPG
jgi:transposase